MVRVDIVGDHVVFDVEGLDQLWAFKGRLEIPRAHVRSVEFNPDLVGRWWHGWKLIGTDLPGVFAAGTFRYHGELVFWDVHDPQKTIVVTLEHERYKKLIVQVENPQIEVERLRAAIAA
jgi:hypothetical protein